MDPSSNNEIQELLKSAVRHNQTTEIDFTSDIASKVSVSSFIKKHSWKTCRPSKIWTEAGFTVRLAREKVPSESQQSEVSYGEDLRNELGLDSSQIDSTTQESLGITTEHAPSENLAITQDIEIPILEDLGQKEENKKSIFVDDEAEEEEEGEEGEEHEEEDDDVSGLDFIDMDGADYENESHENHRALALQSEFEKDQKHLAALMKKFSQDTKEIAFKTEPQPANNKENRHEKPI